MAGLIIDEKARPIPQIQADDGINYQAWKGNQNAGYVYVRDGNNVTLGSTADTAASNTLFGNIKALTEQVKVLSTKLDGLDYKLGHELITIPDNSSKTVFAEAEYTGSHHSSDEHADSRNNGIFYLNVKQLSAGATLKMTITTRDSISDEYFDLKAFPDITKAGKYILEVSSLGYAYRAKYEFVGTGAKATFALNSYIWA